MAFAGFIAGVAVQLQQPALWPAGVYAALAAVAVVMALGVRGQKIEKIFPGVGMGRAADGFCHGGLAGFWPDGLAGRGFQATTLNPALEGRDIAVTGTVLAMPQIGEDAVRFRLGIDAAQLDGRAVTLPPQIIHAGLVFGLHGAREQSHVGGKQRCVRAGTGLAAQTAAAARRRAPGK